MTRHLITAALPYANGPIHIGHLVEYVQTDIMVRHLRQEGETVLFVCADDTHGTPIELNARKQGITPEELVARSYEQHAADFAAFHVSFDEFYTTNSPENEALAGRIWCALRDGGFVERRTSQQFYSENLGRFLPDRMVRGTCPKCGATDQYGDACEVCRSTYEPTDLIDPVDAIEGGTPVLRDTEQLYVRLADFVETIEGWMPDGIGQEAVRNFVKAWIEKGLEPWCVSRDAPYFGFEIPGEPGKFFYVWMDAPVGYIAATQKWCDDHGESLDDWWGPDADTRVTHVIGKDIVYFHTLFWPAMLHAAGFRKPSDVHVHGFLTVEGAKMSKSRGTFVRASTWREHVDADYLRFYYAAKLSDGIDDIDLNLQDFVDRVNADLVNNAVNLCSRVTKFIERRFDGQLAPIDPDHELCGTIAEGLQASRDAFGRWDYRGAIRAIAETGDAVNRFFQDQEPWKVIKDDPEAAKVICSYAFHGAVALMTALQPVVPATVGRFSAALGLDALTWDHAKATWQPASVQGPEMLLERLDLKKVEAIIEAEKAAAEEAALALTAASADDVVEVGTFKDVIEFGDFSKIDLRVGVVEDAKEVEGAKKLLQLTVHCGRRINIFAGVRSAYPDPSVLVGKRVIVVANLAPRKMRFGVSEGMLLATSAEDGEGLQLAILDDATKGGWTVR